MKYIYLDANVIQYIKNSTVTEQFSGPEFYKVIKSISKKYLLPYSEGHLKDLASKYKPENHGYFLDDIRFIFELSAGYVLSLDQDENLVPVKQPKSTIDDFFNKILNESTPEMEVEVEGESFNIDISKMHNNDLLKPFLEANGGVLDPKVMKHFGEHLWEFLDDPSFFKKFREQASLLKKRFIKTDTIINQQSEYFSKLIPFLDFLEESDFSKYTNSFDEVLSSFLSIDGRKLNDMTIGKKIELTYSLLDFNPNFRDKINKKNRPSNMFRDIKNLFFASQAEYYVTEDKATLKKARFVSDVLPINVKVVTMNEFTAKFC